MTHTFTVVHKDYPAPNWQEAIGRYVLDNEIQDDVAAGNYTVDSFTWTDRGSTCDGERIEPKTLRVYFR